MNAGDPIAYMIRHYHADGRMRCWIARKLGVSEGWVGQLCAVMGISFPRLSGECAPCANGHSARVFGVRHGCCAKCGAPVAMGRLIEVDGRAVSRAEVVESVREKRRPGLMAKHMEKWKQRRARS